MHRTRLLREISRVRVDVKGPPEVRTLLHGFNSMAERLQVNDQQRRNMLADVSHELRTPLTVIQGNVEGILDGMYPADEARLKSILEETQVLSRLIEDLRTLALADSGGLHLKKEPTDLNELIRDVVAGFETEVKEKEISLELELGQFEEITIDPQRIREVLSNLIGNALRYTPGQGVVKVGLAESGSGVALSGSTLAPDASAGEVQKKRRCFSSGITDRGLHPPICLISSNDSINPVILAGWGWDFRSRNIWSRHMAGKSGQRVRQGRG